VAAREFHRFIGVSLGGGRGKTTAVARLEPGAEPGELVLAEARARVGHRGGGPPGPVGGAAFRDSVLVDYLDQWVDDKTAVAFDVPLTLPPCVRCTLPCPGVDACEVPVVAWMRSHGPRLSTRSGRSNPGKPAITPYTQRATELLLEHVTLQPREALGQGMGPLAARATYLRRVLSPRLRLNENMIEVHPRATLIRRFGARAERRTRRGDNEATWLERKNMLGQLTHGLTLDRVWPELVVRNVHVFHGVVAAFTARSWSEEAWQGPEEMRGDDPSAVAWKAVEELGSLWQEDGWIWVPPA
jgi:hypothetical protein